MKTPRYLPVAMLLLAAVCARAEGTRSWQQSKYDEFEKGTAKGVAVSSDGTLELAPAFKPIVTTPSSFIWSIKADADGSVYLSAGAPARIYRVTPDGKSTVIFEPQELQVQALAIGPKGVIYAATSPDGRVYRIERRHEKSVQKLAAPEKTNPEKATPSEKIAASEKATAPEKATVDPDWTSSVFYEPKTKYIWDLAVDRSGRVYVATGDHGEIFRVDASGQGALFFKSDEAHIRVLAFDPAGNLIAGSDGSGLIYRISPDGQAFVLYSAPKKEISALAVDKEGNIYAAGMGEKRASSTIGALPSSALVGMPSVPPASHAPGAGASPTPSPAPAPPLPVVTSAPPTGTMGSEVYSIAPDGSPRRIWSSKDEVVYALGFDARGRLLVGTGNKGRVFLIGSEQHFIDLLKASATQVAGFAPAPDGGVYVSTSNLGKLFLLGRAPEAEGSYVSDVFDAHIFSRWGRAEVRGEGHYELWARSGNVDNPDRNWSPWQQVDLNKDAGLPVPPARFVQWKAIFRPGEPNPAIHSVRLNYLPKNVAPVIDDVVVQVGAQPGGESVPAVSPPAPAPAAAAASPDRGSVTVRWTAHDDNDDHLVFALYYRGDGETRWKLLKDKLTARSYTFESGLLPDGGYTIKVAASDAPSHSPDEALSDERESQRFEIDTTPPRIDDLRAAIVGGAIHVTFRASDSFSVIRRAEYSIDAEEWQYIEPVGGLSDARQESYDFSVPLPGEGPAAATGTRTVATAATGGKPNKRGAGVEVPAASVVAAEHLVIVRVWDRFNNVGTAKVVIRPGAADSAR